jgi:hypothetical protein
MNAAIRIAMTNARVQPDGVARLARLVNETATRTSRRAGPLNAR